VGALIYGNFVQLYVQLDCSAATNTTTSVNRKQTESSNPLPWGWSNCYMHEIITSRSK